MNDYQSMVRAAKELRKDAREYGIKLDINSDGTITFYHGTSKKNAESIMRNGFHESTYFSHSVSVTGYGDESPFYYAKVKNKDGVIIQANIDCNYIDFVSGTGEFYLNAKYKPSVCELI